MASITDELREYVGNFYLFRYKDVRESLTAIADRIDEEHERELRGMGEDIVRDVRREWVRLPLDADGVPIHIGDVMAYEDNTKPKEVVALVPPSIFMVEDGPRLADSCHHYHAPTTVEDVLFEFARFWSDEELTDIEHLQPHAAQTIAQYAKKLRLAGDAE